MKRVLLLITIFWAFGLSAQFPGYMGKKVTIGYTAAIRPNFFSVIYSYNTRYSGPVVTNSLSLNVVCSNRREIGLSAGIMSMKVDNSNYEQLGVGISEYEQLHLKLFGLSSRKYSRTRFAPLGIYSKWEVFYARGTLKYDAYSLKEYVSSTAGEQLVAYSGGSIDFNGAGFSYSFGRQRILADKIVMDVGVKGALMYLRGDGERSFEQQLQTGVRWATSEIPLVSVYAGIGFLAF